MNLVPGQRDGEPGRDHFIPARKIDVLNAVIAHGALAGAPEQEKFRQFCRCSGRSIITSISISLNGCATITSISVPTSTITHVSTAQRSNAPMGI
jgi:hypothetical protein